MVLQVNAVEESARGANQDVPRRARENGCGKHSMAKSETPVAAENSRAKRLVAIVTPLYQLPLAEDDKVSLHHLREYLGEFDRFLVGPEKLLRDLAGAGEFCGFTLRTFPERFFKSVQDYSRLMVTEEFYRAFSDYEYILIYQLDCLVFSKNLEEWCRQGWDYVGAPLFKDYRDDPSAGPWLVGNGGFSLRRVASALAVLTSRRPLDDPKERGQMTKWFRSVPFLRRMLVATRTFLLERGFHNTVDWFVRELERHPDIYFQEDLFWASQARRLAPDFTIATPEQALGFSFEMAPRYCYQANSNRLPFGCHAWAKYDRAFWEPFLLK
jgi:hypothetical protein